MGKSTAKGKMVEEPPTKSSAMLSSQQPTAAPNSAARQTTAESEQQIRELAYQLYEQRGRQDGTAEQDWLQAEAIIFSRKQELAA